MNNKQYLLTTTHMKKLLIITLILSATLCNGETVCLRNETLKIGVIMVGDEYTTNTTVVLVRGENKRTVIVKETMYKLFAKYVENGYHEIPPPDNNVVVNFRKSQAEAAWWRDMRRATGGGGNNSSGGDDRPYVGPSYNRIYGPQPETIIVKFK